MALFDQSIEFYTAGRLRSIENQLDASMKAGIRSRGVIATVLDHLRPMRAAGAARVEAAQTRYLQALEA